MIGINDQPEPPVVQLSSTYPLAPMDYVNMYTSENIKTGKAPLPPPIIKDTYTCFGKPIDPNDVLIRSLDQQGIQRLYKNSTTSTESAPPPPPTDETTTQVTLTKVNINNHKKELKKLNHSILIAYLDLLEILVKAPNTQLSLDQQQIDLNSQQQTFKTLRDQKLEDIELLFINMHHLINELRPHQARDNIRCILEMQKRQRLETANKFKTHLFKIVDLLKICISSIQSSNINLSDTLSDNPPRSTQFLDELHSLISNATNLTKTLDKIDNDNKKALNSNTNISKTVIKSLTNDVPMDQDNFIKNSDINSDNNNNINTDHLPLSQENNKGENDKNNLSKNTRDNCEFKDLILCNLIDDFLLKENEF